MTDLVFGWRQLQKHPAASTAAVLSLALAIGAATAAFRLVDAVLLRALPVASPEGLFYVSTSTDVNEWDYPTFRRYREAIQDRADAMVLGMVAPWQVTVGNTSESEKLYRQYVSGNVFGVFGLQPALGRLLTPNDDLKPAGHPVAVLSYDYWTRRFGGDANAIGKTFRAGKYHFEIVGVAPKGFVGTEPGEIADVFLPAMMNAEAINARGWSWFRIWVRPKPGVTAEQVQHRLQAVFTQEHLERIKAFHSDTPKHVVEAFLNEKIALLSARAGSSRLQQQYRRPMFILTFLVALVLLVACVNVANLLTAQAAGRAREMAVRVSIGAGRWRLVRLVLLQSAILAAAASVLGAVFASWAAPIVTTMLRVPGVPVRLVLETGWRELAFSTALAFAVTLLFGLAPALRASAVHPISALKGSDDPSSRRRLMNAMLSAQVAFCILVLFLSGLFIGTFQRLANRPLGFSPDRVLVVDVSAAKESPAEAWMQVADHVRNTPGVQAASLAAWPLLSGNRWTGAVRVPGHAVEVKQPYFLEVSQGFLETMRIPMVDGRDFRAGDAQPRLQGSAPLPGVGIVNEAFARAYFDGANPVGRSVDVRQGKDVAASMEIVGVVRDAAYRDLREAIAPTVYVPINQRGHNTLLVRTAGEPLALASSVRHEITRVRSDLRVSMVQTQNDFVRWHLVRERLLATLSFFFAGVALVLAATGLYGVLNYSVTRQRREIGIRMALGARAPQVVKRISADILTTICLGSAIGLAGGLTSARFIEALLYEVKPTDTGMVVAPILTLVAAALLAGVPPAMRAARIDPAETLRSE